MKDEFVVIRDQVEEFIDSFLAAKLNQKIDEQIHFIGSVKDLVMNHIIDLRDLKDDESRFYKKIEEYNSSLLELLGLRTPDRNVSGFKEDFPELVHSYEEFIKMTDRKRIEEQDNERFKMLAEDSFAVKNIKAAKMIGYFITTSPRRTTNLFRKLFHHPDKSLKVWKRKIYFRNLFQLIIRDFFLSKSFDLINEMNREIAVSCQSAWKSEEKINKHFTSDLQFTDLSRYIPTEDEVSLFDKEINSLMKQMEKMRESIRTRTKENLDEVFSRLDENYKKAGTLELPSRRYNLSKVLSSQKNVDEKYSQMAAGWSNTFFTLLEDWKLNKDLYLNEILEVEELYSLRGEIRQKIIENAVPSVDDIKRVLFSSRSRLEQQKDSQAFREVLLKEKSDLYKQLNSGLIDAASELLLTEGIPETIDELELNLKSNLDKTLVKRAIVKTSVYDRKIRNSEIDHIKPAEMIRFEILPDFLKETHRLKAAVIETLDEIQKNLKDVDKIADFNLESAIASVETSGAGEGEEMNPAAIASEGLQRAISKADEIKSQLFKVYENIIKTSYESVASYNKKMLTLNDVDNILEIRLRIAKARAIEKTVQFRIKTMESIKNFIPWLINSLKQGFSRTGSLYKTFRKRLGLESKQGKISTEISDFLTDAENSVNKLPYVYQRLFRIEPLEDEKFYERRTAELGKLQLAFDKWKQGHYAPVVIVGEKGSGMTTTVNFLLKSISIEEELIRVDIDEIIECEEIFLKFFGRLFGTGFSEPQEISRFLNAAEHNRIIILENIHHLFQRKIGGFGSFRNFFQIVSATSKKVFWITSSNLYAWNYLERVLHISDYFSYIVRLQPFTDEQIIDIIMKRHRVSGYNIRFEPSPDDIQSRTFQKLNDTEQQKYLKEKYFSELNKFARSNLSLSLFFWMSSTREVKNDTITIGSLEGLDFSFLSGLGDEKIFSLYALLVHDGLTAKQHSVIFNQDEEKSRLNLLLLADDGIIIRSNGKFVINPMLYRQTVSLLQTKNILH